MEFTDLALMSKTDIQHRRILTVILQNAVLVMVGIENKSWSIFCWIMLSFISLF